LPGPSVPLTSLSQSDEARIQRIAGSDAAQLSGLGLYPGVVIKVRQKFPTLVIQAGETEVALENQVAANIEVTRI
jgi:Fe2+ transport system protein FeoA